MELAPTPIARLACIICLWLAATGSNAQEAEWPRAIQAKSGTIIIYQPQPESFVGNKFTSRAAVSYTEDMGEPVFGAIWTEGTINTDRDSRMVSLENIKVTNVKFPSVADTARISKFKALLELEIPKWELEISLDRLAASLQAIEDEKSLAGRIKNDPPTIIYKNTPSLLVVIDGEPRIQKDDDLGVERVINTPYVIVKNDDGKFYLMLSPLWFVAPSATGDFKFTDALPKKVIDVEKKIELKTGNKREPGKTKTDTIPAIIVATSPSELIQSTGDGKFIPIQGTNLLYMSNTDSDIFMDSTSQQYFLLLSGRWYHSKTLQGPWTYMAPDK